MTRYLLDTNAVSSLMREPHGAVAVRIREVGIAQVCTSAIVAAELRYGAERLGGSRLAQRVDEALSVLRVLPFEPPADAAYARIRSSLEALGQPIGGNDLFIAAHAVAADCVLVTDNIREFSRVSELSWENWQRQVR